MPTFAGADALAGKRVCFEKVSISGMVMLGKGNGRLRDQVHIYPTATEAL